MFKKVVSLQPASPFFSLLSQYQHSAYLQPVIILALKRGVVKKEIMKKIKEEKNIRILWTFYILHLRSKLFFLV
jgi:hypothetical protein